MTHNELFTLAAGSLTLVCLWFWSSWLAFRRHEKQMEAILAENLRLWTQNNERRDFKDRWTSSLYLSLILFVSGVFFVLLFLPIWYDAVSRLAELVYVWWVLRL